LAGAFETDRPVAYAPQQPWILNDTIRSNILFGSKLDEKRYNETVSACALDHDIAQLPAGHETEIVSEESSNFYNVIVHIVNPKRPRSPKLCLIFFVFLAVLSRSYGNYHVFNMSTLVNQKVHSLDVLDSKIQL